jgi:hypothetical protein
MLQAHGITFAMAGKAKYVATASSAIAASFRKCHHSMMRVAAGA